MATSSIKYLSELPAHFASRWDKRLVRLVSDILCPPVTVAFGLMLTVYQTGNPRDWMMAGIAIALLIGVPVSYILMESACR